MRWLITGASGALGSYLLRASAGESVIAWSGSTRTPPFVPVDLTDPDAIARAFEAAKPDIVVHAGAMSRVEACHCDPELASRINTTGTDLLCRLGGRSRLVYVSTDMVFDGERAPYRESDAPSPLSVYGKTKADGELPVQPIPNGVVARLSLLFGPTAQPTFFSHLVQALEVGEPVSLFTDEWRTPLGLAAAARMLIALARSDFTGTIHLGGSERMSRWEMGRRLARHLRLSDAILNPRERNTAGSAEPRPRDVSLDTTLWRTHFPSVAIPFFEESLADMLNEKRGHTIG
jgi:dTDP-4-dehydrorhamnose reductase